MNAQFYQARHQVGGYKPEQYDMQALFTHPELSRWVISQGRVRVLDYGVGKGHFLRYLCEGLKDRCCPIEHAHGYDLVQSPGNIFDTFKFNFEFKEARPDFSIYGLFSFIACNHVLEHVFETEALLRSLRSHMKPDGLCVVSVPNCAYWPNRIAALWGCQPLGSELGTERITYGFRPQWMQDSLAHCMPSGHVRDFTPAGLQDLCEHCGFTVVGWWKQSFGLLAKLSPHAARNIAVILKA